LEIYANKTSQYWREHIYERGTSDEELGKKKNNNNGGSDNDNNNNNNNSRRRTKEAG
jgi:hypothetical protein